jgi:hypothetical protein
MAKIIKTVQDVLQSKNYLETGALVKEIENFTTRNCDVALQEKEKELQQEIACY